MPRSEITKQVVARSGITPSYEAANVDGNSFENLSGQENIIHVKNADASDHTVTVVTPQTVSALAVADLAVVVTAGEERLIGPFPTGTFNQTDNQVNVDYDAVTSVTVAVFQV